MSRQLLKPGWKMVKFGDIVENIAARVDPAEAQTDIYVGLEHLDPETLHLRQWGYPSDVTGQKLTFKKGDVIFGRRRAYQRKLAVAEFDGICSAHAMVIRAKPQIILPKFLPFFLKSDMFMDRAIEISVGSLSPTINWNTLRVQEFPLPPIEEQKRIAEILWAADESIVTFESSLVSLGSFMRCEAERRLDLLNCRELALPETLSKSPESGCSAPPSPDETGHWVLSLSALSKDGYCANNLKPVKKSANMLNALLHRGDLLISRSNTVDLVGLAGIYDEDCDDVSFPDTMMRLQVNRDLALPEYIELVLLSSYGRKHMMKTAAGTSSSMKKINRKTLGEFILPLPSIAVQGEIVTYLSSYKVHRKQIEKHIRYMRNLQAALCNNILGGAHV